MVFLLEQVGFNLRSRRIYSLGPPAQGLYRRSELRRPTSTSVTIGELYFSMKQLPVETLSFSKETQVSPNPAPGLVPWEYTVIGG